MFLYENKAAYDKVINAKYQAKQRVRELDAKRRKLKEDLEAREDAYNRSLNSEYSNKSDKDKLRVRSLLYFASLSELFFLHPCFPVF